MIFVWVSFPPEGTRRNDSRKEGGEDLVFTVEQGTAIVWVIVGSASGPRSVSDELGLPWPEQGTWPEFRPLRWAPGDGRSREEEKNEEKARGRMGKMRRNPKTGGGRATPFSCRPLTALGGAATCGKKPAVFASVRPFAASDVTCAGRNRNIVENPSESVHMAKVTLDNRTRGNMGSQSRFRSWARFFLFLADNLFYQNYSTLKDPKNSHGA